MRPLEIYIHIPFCIRKCKYCDFLSAPSTRKERKLYVESLCQKIKSYDELSKAYRVISIFVGGGTPSVLEPEQMEEIFDTVRAVFQVEKDAEITVEMNPGTVTREKLAVYKRAGVNRLSIGLQSADNRELRELGRIHTYEEFLSTYHLAREAGFDNINIDLISAIPYQTAESWERTLRLTAELEPEHISAYSLIIEEGTPFFERYREGKHADELPDEEEERLMYQNTKKILEEYGYRRYEISNYAKPGYECRHNLGYWNRTEYLGIGAGAASLIRNRRWTEEAELWGVQDSLARCREQETETSAEVQVLSTQEQMEEYVFLGLRKMEGVSRQQFKAEFGRSMEEIYGAVIESMKEKGLLEEVNIVQKANNQKEASIVQKAGNQEETGNTAGTDSYIRLTERGIDVCNWVLSEFLL